MENIFKICKDDLYINVIGFWYLRKEGRKKDRKKDKKIGRKKENNN